MGFTANVLGLVGKEEIDGCRMGAVVGEGERHGDYRTYGVSQIVLWMLEWWV